MSFHTFPPKLSPASRNRSAAAIWILWLATLASPAALLGGDSQKVERQRLADHVTYLASDELEGRGVDTKGIEKAAQYIRDELAAAGLQPAVFRNSPFQQFAISVGAEMGNPERNRLVLLGPPGGDQDRDPRRIVLELGKDFNPLALGGSGSVEAPLVFAGYGISAPQHGYDDYDGLDVKGKVVVILRKEPQQEDPDSAFNGTRSSRHAYFSAKIANASEHGAAAVILVNDALDIQRSRAAARRRWNQLLNRLAEKKEDLAKDELTGDAFARHRNDVVRLARQLIATGEQLTGDFDRLLPIDGAGRDSTHPKMPVFFVRRATIDQLVQSAWGKSLADLEREIDQGPAPRSGPLTGWKAQCQSEIIHRKVQVKNVAAVLPGQGTLADETVVVGAHYDHLGYGGDGSLARGERAIHNGADDNASGTAALIEIARALAQTPPEGDRRRIVFVAFTAEERGLLGSGQYLRDPPYPLDTTVAMINMDMIGRLKDDRLILYGTGTAKPFDGWIEELNEQYGFQLKKEPGGYGPSDHAAFYGKKIPVLHFFTGSHPDYHRPSDDVDKVNFVGMERIANMVADMVVRVATVPDRPEYVAIQRAARRTGGDRPYFGSIPDFGREIEGYPLMGVTEGSPAEAAGIREGDVIIQLGASKITGLEDFDSALRKFKAGDTVPVKIRRGDEELTVEVTLDPPR